MKKEAVIIGAGQTGRGFIAPILNKNGYHITFLDKDEDLVERLNKEKCYKVAYFANAKPAIQITGFEAISMLDAKAAKILSNADVITTSVYASHVKELVPIVSYATKLNKQKQPLNIICCENGVNVKKPLVEAHLPCTIIEGVIFCTTLQPNKDSLDLLCEDYPEIPIDGSVLNNQLKIEGMPLNMEFSSLIQRKIYTYNFMSAIVAYLGDYLEYNIYGEAANDARISTVMEQILPLISKLIAKDYHIPYDEQLKFTKRAISKFKNKEIYDTISRNSVQVIRKLGEKERILTPLRLAFEQDEDMHLFLLICACACRYGIEKEEMDIETVYARIQNVCNDEVTSYIKKLTHMFLEGKKIEQIMTFHK